jgi:iron complex outermembrane receptor protein
MSVRKLSQDHHSTRHCSKAPLFRTSFTKSKLTSLVLLALATGQPMFAAAEEAAASEAKNAKDEQVEKIQVTGIRSSIKESLFIKQNATSVVDVVVAEDIGKFPDENLAEALQRVPGITITRNGGEGQNILVRGMGSGYNVTTLNGRKLASENSGRDFNYDTIASELVNVLAVYKSPEARLLEGGIGAIVDVQTRKPLDLGGFTLTGSAKGIYESRTGDIHPHASLLVGDIFQDGNLGVLLSAAYSKKTLRNDTYSATGFYDPAESITEEATVAIDQNKDGVISNNERFPSKIPGYMYYANEQDVRERLGSTLAIQWQPNDDFELLVDGLYSRYNTDGAKYQIGFVNYDESWTPGTPVFTNPTFGDDGRVVAVQQSNNPMVELLNLSTPRKTDTWMLGSNARWKMTEQLTLLADFAHSKAKDSNTGDNRFIVARGFVDSISIDYSKGNKLPDVVLAPGLTAQQNYGAHYSRNTGIGVEDQIDDGKLQLQFTPENSLIAQIDAGLHYVKQSKGQNEYASSNPSMFSRGGFYLTRDKFAFDNSTVFKQGEFELFKIPQNVFRPANFDKFLDGENGVHPQPWPSFDYDALLDYYRSLNATAANRFIEPSLQLAGAYTIEETVTSAFVQVKLEDELAGLPYMLNFGLRGSNTEVSSLGFVQDFASIVLDGKGQPTGNDWRKTKPVTFSGDYSKILPSMNFKLNLQDDVIFRFSAAKVMSRPALTHLKPWIAVNFTSRKEGLPTMTMGNPSLPPELANQADITLEWYLADSSQLSGGIFVKDIQSFIEKNGSAGNAYGGSYYVDMPTSGQYGAMVKGTEIAWQQSMEHWLPAPFDGLGLQLNYTYVDSEYDDPARKKLPFQNMSKNSYNAVVYYEKDGIQARLAYNWRSKFLQYPDDWGGPSWISDYGQLDASLSYDINKHLTLFTEASNLSNERYWGYVKQEDQVNWLERFGTQVAIGVRGSF